MDAFIRIALRIGEINDALVDRELGDDPPCATMYAAYFMPPGSIEVRGGNDHVVHLFLGRIDGENVIDLVARDLEARKESAACRLLACSPAGTVKVGCRGPQLPLPCLVLHRKGIVDLLSDHLDIAGLLGVVAPRGGSPLGRLPVLAVCTACARVDLPGAIGGVAEILEIDTIPDNLQLGFEAAQWQIGSLLVTPRSEIRIGDSGPDSGLRINLAFGCVIGIHIRIRICHEIDAVANDLEVRTPHAGQLHGSISGARSIHPGGGREGLIEIQEIICIHRDAALSVKLCCASKWRVNLSDLSYDGTLPVMWDSAFPQFRWISEVERHNRLRFRAWIFRTRQPRQWVASQ